MSIETINLIPMAGAGQRFRDAGYTLPKPLVPVDGKPMILRACEALPAAKKWVFVVRNDFIQADETIAYLTKAYPGCDIVQIDYLTEGQASSCALAADLLPDDAPLLIGPCDNGMLWNRDRYAALTAEGATDAIIWTVRHYPGAGRKPEMYGWVRTESDRAKSVSCKVAISDEPLNDHAIVGTFYFRRSAFFKDAYKKLVAANRRINNEFYVDELMNILIEEGLQVRIFEIDKYLCWGTPDDLKTYEYWRRFFKEAY
jgi:NDP-sugar pyrophosphorylase family protein